MCVSHLVVSDSLPPHGPIRFLCPCNSPGKNTGVDCCPLLQGIFLTQGLNPGFLHCRQILYHLSHQQNNGDYFFQLGLWRVVYYTIYNPPNSFIAYVKNNVTSAVTEVERTWSNCPKVTHKFLKGWERELNRFAFGTVTKVYRLNLWLEKWRYIWLTWLYNTRKAVSQDGSAKWDTKCPSGG